jgi:hypothetical protein
MRVAFAARHNMAVDGMLMIMMMVVKGETAGNLRTEQLDIVRVFAHCIRMADTAEMIIEA